MYILCCMVKGGHSDPEAMQIEVLPWEPDSSEVRRH